MKRLTRFQRNIDQTFKTLLLHQQHCTRVVCEMCQPIIGKAKR